MTAPEPVSRRSAPGAPRTIAAIVLVMVALAGVLAGIVIDRTLLRPRPAQAWMQPGGAMRPVDWRGPRGAMMSERLTRELDLTAEQRARIDSIVRRQSVALREITDESRPRVRAVVRQTRLEIDSVLTPGQRERMRELRRSPGRRGSPR